MLSAGGTSFGRPVGGCEHWLGDREAAFAFRINPIDQLGDGQRGELFERSEFQEEHGLAGCAEHIRRASAGIGAGLEIRGARQ